MSSHDFCTKLAILVETSYGDELKKKDDEIKQLKQQISDLEESLRYEKKQHDSAERCIASIRDILNKC